MALYLPTYYDFATGLWLNEEQAYGPIMLLLCLFHFWRETERLGEVISPPANIVGWILLVFGLLLYVLGRSLEILIFEVGSQIPVYAAVLLLGGGYPLVRAYSLPLLFLMFLAPLPGFLVDELTGSLKQQVSHLAEILVYQLGYPIGREGVTLSVGQYRLLVADACSGLNSMFSLTAMGLFYLSLMEHPGWLRNGVLIGSILPIAFVANVIRVIILILITYHFGDEVAQGFLHGFASILMFSVALGLLFGIDGGLGWLEQHSGPRNMHIG